MSIKSDGVTCCRDSVNSTNNQAAVTLSILHHAGARSNSSSKSVSARRVYQLNYLDRILISLTALLTFSPLHAQKMVEGSAIVTSRIGSASAIDASGKRISTASHDILHPRGLTLSTIKDAHIFLTFSNGVALVLTESSVVQCAHYSQRPFDKEDQALGLEPSVSNLKLSLIEGQIVVASNRLSPLSELRVQLPKGELRLHKGTCLIRLDTTGLHIIAYDGNLTYYYPDSESREFVSAPMGIRISDQSMGRQQVAEATTVESLEAKQTRICQAAQHASKRVNFQANDTTNLPPEPVLIVRPQYFQQPYSRPYQFIE